MVTGTNTKQYLVRHQDGLESGPFTAAALKSLAQSGRVGSEDLISPVGSDRWAKAYKVKGLGIERTLPLEEETGQWLYQLDGAAIGPVSIDVIRQILIDTEQGLDTPIRRPHDREWHPASFYGEFASVAPSEQQRRAAGMGTTAKRVRLGILVAVVLAVTGYFVIITIPEEQSFQRELDQLDATNRAQAELSVELTEREVEQLRGIRVNDGCITARAVYAFRSEWNMPKHSTDALDEQVKEKVESIRATDAGLRDAAAILGDPFTASVVFLDEGRFVAVQEVRGDAIRVL